ncbi:AMP-binding protein [Amycolatopsis nalaikhensis]|uniref:AMP-binding protein n=1 Tax=Amycolatopsis nalaikhensis TaxID=715472 RepID=A0ABY8Y3S4_9PSEU|nr:AMP-binding protein [Amycolatopsis sp. 2-2]WIV62262.1 AMP-binding protein [Amycolatopsis sp. 2-2]
MGPPARSAPTGWTTGAAASTSRSRTSTNARTGNSAPASPSGTATTRSPTGKLGDRVHRIVGGLTELGLRRGDRGVLLLANGPEFFEAEHALFVGGFVRTALSVRLHLREVVHILTDCAASVVFAGPDWAERLAGVRAQLPALRSVVTVGGGPGDTTLAALRAADPVPPARPGAGDPAAILYTSGTTGLPKGATLSHANWVAMVRNELVELPRPPTATSSCTSRR